MKSPSTVLHQIKTLVKETRKSLLHFVFPAYCIHCQEEDVESDFLFCSSCQEMIEPFPLDYCFTKKAVAVEKEGVVLALLRERNGSMQQEVLTTMAALMALQILHLQWPIPDIILSSPLDPVNRLLAEILSSWFAVPSHHWIQSESLWRPKICSDKVLLVVDLFLSFSASWDLLHEGAPSQIFMIGFCQKEGKSCFI